MRFNYPQHLLLDVNKANLNYSNRYWVLQYFKSFTKDQYFSTTLNFINNPTKNNLLNFRDEKSTTVTFMTSDSYFTASKQNNSNPSRVRKLSHAKQKFLNTTNDFTMASLYKHNANTDSTPINHLMSSSLTHLLFDINFIKKERLYTKLKYSRSPAYDIVSGGAAALMSAFIGFLISEKFGIELVDSGDFYIGFMYVVFIACACRPLLKILDVHKMNWSIFSLNHALDFFQTLFFFCAKFVNFYLIRVWNLVSTLWAKPSTLNIILFIIICLLW